MKLTDAQPMFNVSLPFFCPKSEKESNGFSEKNGGVHGRHIYDENDSNSALRNLQKLS
jgi:hypothetical protein